MSYDFIKFTYMSRNVLINRHKIVAIEAINGEGSLIRTEHLNFQVDQTQKTALEMVEGANTGGKHNGEKSFQDKQKIVRRAQYLP